MVKLSTRLRYPQLHRCKANYESRTVETGTDTCNATLPKSVQLDRDAIYVRTATRVSPSAVASEAEAGPGEWRRALLGEPPITTRAAARLSLSA